MTPIPQVDQTAAFGNCLQTRQYFRCPCVSGRQSVDFDLCQVGWKTKIRRGQVWLTILVRRKCVTHACDDSTSSSGEMAFAMELLRFQPILKQAIWGGRRLGDELGKPIDDRQNVAESWEVADLADDQSVVVGGIAAGQSIEQLIASDRDQLLGPNAHWDRFPLLIKFLDANRQLSVQVHPGREMAGKHPEVTTGKAEMWYVIAADPQSTVSVGLKAGVDRTTLEEAIANQSVQSCLHTYHVSAGDCIFLRPGTVHSLGAGLLIAEIQQPNNITFRLDDWGRLGPDGKPRELHIDWALQVIDFELGPVDRIEKRPIDADSATLVDNEFFTVYEHRGPAAVELTNGGHPQVWMQLAGQAQTGDPQTPQVSAGETVVVPAVRPKEYSRFSLSQDALALSAYVRNTDGK